jgi:hypothetical protein
MTLTTVRYTLKLYNDRRNAQVVNLIYLSVYRGPGSSVGIATSYGLGGPGIEFRWGRDFSHRSRPALGPT